MRCYQDRIEAHGILIIFNNKKAMHTFSTKSELDFFSRKLLSKYIILFSCSLGCLFILTSWKWNAQETDPYQIAEGKISSEVLQRYLARSITQAEFLASDSFYNDGIYPYKEDDIRMLKHIGAKFIGRAVYSWGKEEIFTTPAFWHNAQDLMQRLHGSDPTMIFQAAIFEIVTSKVNKIKIPTWVFQAFDKPVEQRNFRYEDMLNEQGIFVNHWREGSSVPDISKLETQLYFYYLAVRYMQIGIEAIHFGQAELMAMEDRKQDYEAWQSLLSKVRQAAKKDTRRGVILCDAHLPNGGIAVNGHLLFDFVSFPLRLKEILNKPQEVSLEKDYLDAIYNKTIGGITPSGWSCERSPYLVEFDNFGISKHRDEANLLDHYAWGYDEISWFSKQEEDYQHEFLKYAQEWIAKNDTVGHLQMPGSRIITGLSSNRFRANNKSEQCPLGQNVEQAIKEIWTN